MVKLIFYGGVNEIGGNKILLEDKGTKIFLDFGQSFAFGAEYFYSKKYDLNALPNDEVMERDLQSALSSYRNFADNMK